MFDVIRNAWKIPDLRKKLLYTFLLIIIFRLGSVIPVPFISSAAMQEFLNTGGGGNTLIDFLNTFSGGAFGNATIFAMSISPYINASIIMQLLTVAIPALERLQKEGEEGRKVIAQYTRYLAVILGFIQATGLFFTIRNAITTDGRGVLGFFVITLTFTAGTAFLMWLGEQINEKGIGNGISLIIFAGIVSRAPQMVAALYQVTRISDTGWFNVLAIVVIAIALIVFVVFMNESERRIPVQYSKRVVGRKMYGGQSTHIPIKLLGAGVIPIIFAMSIMAFPATVAQFFGKTASSEGWIGKLLTWLSPSSAFYSICYFFLIIFFTYFYIAIQFNPVEIANNMKKNGGFIPGLRPGKPTSDYISRVLSRVTLAGAFFLGFISVLPVILSRFSAVPITIGGTSLLIVVGVALETTKQLESHMLMRHYKGFLE